MRKPKVFGGSWLFKKRISSEDGQDNQTLSAITTKDHKNKGKHEKKDKKKTTTTKNDETKAPIKIISKDIKIIYTNADQLTLSKKHELQALSQKEKPHLISICEVKTEAGTLKSLHE